MLKRLRIKFIALNMVIVAAVLVLTFSAVCILDYQQSVTAVTQELDATLARVATPEDTHRQKKRLDNPWFGLLVPNVGLIGTYGGFGDFDDFGELDDLDDLDDLDGFEGLNSYNNLGDFDSYHNPNDPTTPKGEERIDTETIEEPNTPSALAPDALSDEDKTDEIEENANNASPHANESDIPNEDQDPEELADRESALPPRIGGPDEEKSIPVATYALLDNTLFELSKHTTASIDDEVLQQATQEIADAPDGHGELQDLGLYYAKRTIDGIPCVAFADASAANSWQSVAIILTGVGLIALGAFFIISLFFSQWALAPVAKAWEKQRQFVADASHDLKTPLTVILANSAILTEHPERTISEQKQWIESTEHEALSMQALVNDLLTLARIDETEANPQLPDPTSVSERIDFSDLVEGELLQMESLAFEHGIELNSAVTPNLFVSGDGASLRRIVTTLVDNACKYAGAGQTVSVQLNATGRKAVLQVHNTGSAIDPADLPHIFDRFYRADKARNRNDIGGHGLGLAIAQALASERGGSLTAQSTEAEGTTFTLTLPLA